MKHGLIQLLSENKGKSSIKAEADADGLVHVYLKGVISADWGVSANDLRTSLSMADGAPAKLHINSPGGDVFEGREMQSIIAGHRADVDVIVEGTAASAATIVAMAAKSVGMAAGSRYMIHNGWTVTVADRHGHKAAFDLLAGFDEELAAEYAKYSGGEIKQMAEWMDAETWFTAAQAVEHGFAQSVVDNSQRTSNHASWALSAYRNAPADEPPTKPSNEAWQAMRAALKNNLENLIA